jgi:hypothetical protein
VSKRDARKDQDEAMRLGAIAADALAMDDAWSGLASIATTGFHLVEALQRGGKLEVVHDGREYIINLPAYPIGCYIRVIPNPEPKAPKRPSAKRGRTVH